MSSLKYDRKRILLTIHNTIDTRKAKYHADKRKKDGPTSINGRIMTFGNLYMIDQNDVNRLNKEFRKEQLGVECFIKGNLEKGFVLWIKKKLSKEENMSKED